MKSLVPSFLFLPTFTALMTFTSLVRPSVVSFARGSDTLLLVHSLSGISGMFVTFALPGHP